MQKSVTQRVLRVFWEHICRYKGAAILLFCSVVAVSIVGIAIPWFYKLFFDTLAQYQNGSADTIAPRLLMLLAAIVGLKGLGIILRRVRGFTNIYFESHVMTDLMRTAFNHLMRHSFRFFSDNFAGSLVRKVNRLSRSFEEITDQTQFSLLPQIVVVGGIIIVLWTRHALLGFVLLLGSVIFFALHVFVARWKQKYDLARAAKDSEATGVLADALANSANIKLFTGYDHERSLFRNVTEELHRIRSYSWKLGEWIEGAQGLLMLAIEAAMLYTAIRLWQNGALTVGDFVLIQVYLINLFERLWDFGHVLRRLYESFADAAQMIEILEMPHEIRDHRAATPILVKHGEIEFKNVSFSFQKTREVLDTFNLAIRAGEKVALVGPSGAGKSTLTKLLFRFYDIDRGEILIDGQNIAKVTQDSLHAQIALVPQESVLFHRTLKENILYGRGDASDTDVIEAAKKAHCHEFISGFPDGYDTYVGERGVKLSGGERQRVAIARAILKNAPILVLDEATSSLDSESEALIQDALKRLMHERTTLVIAHRLSTIMQMDRIVVMNEGRTVAVGTHAELLQEGGIYKKLWEIQAGGFIA